LPSPTNTCPDTPERRDARFVFHPYSNARETLEHGSLVMERGEGVHVIDTAGNRYLEAMSGLWCVGLGFSEERLIRAAERQLRTLPYYHSFSLKSHAPQIDLAEKLVTMAPGGMSKAFFTNSGSEANDTAIKMIWYRANALGQPKRKKIIGRKRGYHGITIGSGSLTGIARNHESFDLPLPGFLHVSAPHFWKDGAGSETESEFATRLADELEALVLREGPETIAAFFAEPVMGAGGVIVPPETYWDKIQAVLRRYDILMVADEVICGFGRTGRMFGCETYAITPDILVLSKQLSSAYMPISAVLINDRVFDPIAEHTAVLGSFGHGFTGSGHPVAAAVARETIAIIEERNLVAHAAETGAHMQRALRALRGNPFVGEVRGVGLIAAVETVSDKVATRTVTPPGALGARIAARMQGYGVISRAMGDAVAFCPPLISEKHDIDVMVAALERALVDEAIHLEGTEA